MPTDDSKPNFEVLEKQLAKDTLEEALKKLHGEIIGDIEKNKSTFSLEIQKTLSSFKENLEKSVSKEIDTKLSSLFDKHFKDTSTKIASNFYESFSPVLERSEEDLQRLHNQGEKTLRSWRDMMEQYKSIWTRPFLIVFCSSILVGVFISILSTYFLGKSKRELEEYYEKKLSSYENLVLFYYERDKKNSEANEKTKLPSHEINKTLGKKKK